MPRRKRPYIPKVKGCPECSQRRINCDGTRPSCQKCASKGIPCSGFDVKYRFRQGLPQGPRTSKTRKSASPETFVNECTTLDASLADSTSATSDGVEETGSSEFQLLCQVDDATLLNWATISDLIPGAQSLNNIDNGEECIENLLSEQGQEISKLLDRCEITQTDSSPAFGLAPLKPWQEFLLTYFSNNIAPEMVVLDDSHNGWRNLILPMAWTDELIMNSVLSASAFHLATKTGAECVPDPQRLYGQAIGELQRRRNLAECDHQTKEAVVMSIMILLVSVIVNGCSDFPIIFGMLESALDAVGGESGFLDGGEVGEFFVRQIRKMRVYAAPLLSQDAGLHAMMHHAHSSFECLRFYDKLHPAKSRTLKLLGDLRQQAFDIYLDRVLAGGSRTSSRHMIEHFITAVQSLAVGSPGSHVLVWPVFIVASESCKQEHREIFEEFLQKQYRRNGFVNILRALEFLKKIWARESNADWPALLPEPQVFVM